MVRYDIVDDMMGEQMELALRGPKRRPARALGWQDLLRDWEVQRWELVSNCVS